ncbi:DUF421 domain-containing protein [Aquibacillus salsiterrae]|uniref:DUF421 domain-containing protein n=1 Tax=Aquibacillus salsiterrae TaxID=2950439 RepID=A0A9X3WIK4_9BACI|nr:DUF421 domain-containing protein [Aquibacillus salsiterrae]MDC3417706.1 DUF421 domain-containing protein [Aquibacillus salsiterrae]
MSTYEIILRVALSFLVLLTLTRLMGRKELSQLTFFNFVSGIAIGSIAASLAVDQNLSIQNGVAALSGWAALTIVMGLIDIKSKAARKIIAGQPMILIKDGRIMEDEMRKARIDIDSLNSLLREKKVFSLADVKYAVFETDGKLSVLKKDENQPTTKADINVHPSNKKYPIPTEVVSDGAINAKNLSKLQLDEDWLYHQLESAGVGDIKDVFYAEVQSDGTLYIDQKNDVVH